MMVERQKFTSLHIDIEKNEFRLNGKDMRMVSRIDLEFNNGKWSLLVTKDELYEQAMTTGVME